MIYACTIAIVVLVVILSYRNVVHERFDAQLLVPFYQYYVPFGSYVFKKRGFWD